MAAFFFHDLGSGSSLFLRIAILCFQEYMFSLRQVKPWDRPNLSEEVGDEVRGGRRMDE